MSTLFIWAHSSVEYIQSDEQLAPEQKQAALLVLRTGRLERHRDIYGGYPGEAAVVGNYVVFSDCDHNGAPQLEVYTLGEWTAEAEKLLAEFADEDSSYDD